MNTLKAKIMLLLLALATLAAIPTQLHADGGPPTNCFPDHVCVPPA